jgi:hypothetical protein
LINGLNIWGFDYFSYHNCILLWADLLELLDSVGMAMNNVHVGDVDVAVAVAVESFVGMSYLVDP